MNEKFKVIYIGNFYKVPEFIAQDDSFELIEILCEKEKFSDELLTFSMVRNVPFNFYEEINKKEYINRMKNRIDFFIMCCFGKILPSFFVYNIEGYNIHYSYLPYYKGRHPTFWATINDEMHVGITIHKVTEQIDYGEIISRKKVAYYLWENEQDLFEKLTELIPDLLKALVMYKRGLKVERVNNVKGYYYRKVSPGDYKISIEKDAPNMIFNKIRAQYRYKGAPLNYNGKTFWIKKAIFTYNPQKYKGKPAILYKDNLYIVLLEYTEEK